MHCLWISLSFFFFLLYRRPSIFTLFPYTTLFRSDFFSDETIKLVGQIDVSCRHDRGPPQGCRFRVHCSTKRQLDRKSTRLNSSHQIISYAVFCLKKKNNNSQL